MIRTATKLFVAWLVLATINFELLRLAELQIINIEIDTSVFFPISVFKLHFHTAGLKYALIFSIGLFLSLKYSSRIKLIHIWLISILFIVIGNLAQGSIDLGFYKPFYERGIQYYHDAIKIVEWHQWLANFTENQEFLLTHSKTHPPFAVLLHYVVLKAGNGGLGVLTITFTILSSFSPIILWKILKTIQVPIARRNMLAILFAVIPAYNIYSCISLDGVILTCSLLFLYGLIRIIRYGMHFQGLLFYLAGIVLVNALTFGGIFLVLVTFFVGVRNYWMKRNLDVICLLGGTLVLGIVINELLGLYFGYSHFLGFIQACSFENPDGFRAISEPINYLFTRIENIAEIALFLSLGCLAVLFHPEQLEVRFLDINDDWNAVSIIGIFVLLLLFISGAFRTGETARACLFIYPYIFLAFRKIKNPLLTHITMIAGLQTIVMQLFGEYVW